VSLLHASHLYPQERTIIQKKLSKLKKIDREFLLTDGSVNSYGYRLLTSGYLIDEYKKNPIGYAMHRREDGVLVRWEDLRVDGDKVYGKPVINLSHINGQRTVDEIENGFLNAASVGHIVMLEASEEADLKLDGQTGPTVTKWFNRECSLVDVPSNYNALKNLYDVDDNLLNLSDLTKQKLPTMKEIKFTSAQIQALNLSADADEVLVSKTFNDLVAKAAKTDSLQTQLDTLNASVTTDKVNDLVAKGLADKKVTKEVADKLKVTFAKNHEGLKDLIDSMPSYEPVTKQIDEKKASGDKFKDLNWDQLDEQGLLPDLKANHFDMFKDKFKAEFGKDYAA